MAMIQQAESPQVGDTALGSQNMALEVSRHIGQFGTGRRGCWRLPGISLEKQELVCSPNKHNNRKRGTALEILHVSGFLLRWYG